MGDLGFLGGEDWFEAGRFVGTFGLRTAAAVDATAFFVQAYAAPAVGAVGRIGHGSSSNGWWTFGVAPAGDRNGSFGQ